MPHHAHSIDVAVRMPSGLTNRELRIRPHVDRLHEAIQQC
jgi:hypothetical protein